MSYTKQNTRVENLVIETSFDAAGTALVVFCHAQLRTRLANDQVPTEIGDLPMKSFGFNLIGLPVSTTNYTAATKTANGVQIAALVRQMILDEATRQGI